MKPKFIIIFTSQVLLQTRKALITIAFRTEIWCTRGKIKAKTEERIYIWNDVCIRNTEWVGSNHRQYMNVAIKM